MTAYDPLPVVAFGARGVLVRDPLPLLLRELSRAGGRWSPKALHEWYRRELHDPLWSGQLDEGEFWELLLLNSGVPMQELPRWQGEWETWNTAVDLRAELARWSEQATLGLAAAHRADWLRPLLGPAGLAGRLHPMCAIISDEHQQPGVTALLLELLADGLPEPEADRLFVDADPWALDVAEQAGWAVLEADSELTWTWEVDAWLAGAAED